MSKAQSMMSGSAVSHKPSTTTEIDAAIADLGEHSEEFARLGAAAKAKLLRACIPRLVDGAPQWVAKGCRAKGLIMDEAGEEWLAGPMPTIRMSRLLAESLEKIEQSGKPSLGVAAKTGIGGRLEVEVFPNSKIDKALFSGFKGHVLMQEGIDRAAAEERQARFYGSARASGGISLVLGAGNVSSIPPMDAFTKMFIYGRVVLLKMNPVNEWVGPCLERALKPLIDSGYLRIVYGGGDIGKYLVENKGISDVHITGSDRTHDLIVWGPEGEERERRKRENSPILTIPIESELGNVSPVAIVPYDYSADEILFQARNVASMICNNASFNCNAAKMLITANNWRQREEFLRLVRGFLDTIPSRNAYYPGAFDRYRSLVGDRDGVIKIGIEDETRLPWTLITGIDSSDEKEPLFTVEPFCSILSETQIGTSDPVQFLHAATEFMNERLWGTLNATLIISPQLEKDPTIAKALDQCILDLRYGTVTINHWAAICYGATTLPWGGHESATLDNIQSGLGWVHNTYMLEGIDKSVIRGGIKMWPDPPWFAGNRATTGMGPRLVKMEASPGWGKVPGIALRSLFS
ncbi:MAG: aldehyde dehydrogenase [Myxococcales bacterium]|nr:aldehyde dehydrogenase [Myxococcales bacterium]